MSLEQRLMSDPTILDLCLDLERMRQKRELQEIERDPAAHRDTKLMSDAGLRYRYFEAKTGKTTRVRFAWATTPNAAGYYLTWQENINSKGGKREYVRGHKLRKDAKDSALKSFNRFKEQP